MLITAMQFLLVQNRQQTHDWILIGEGANELGIQECHVENKNTVSQKIVGKILRSYWKEKPMREVYIIQRGCKCLVGKPLRWGEEKTPNIPKDLNLCHKLWYSDPFIFATQCRKPLIFQAIDCVRSNLSLKY